MSEINLLPTELKPKGGALKVSNFLVTLRMLSIAVFLIVLVVVIAANIALSFQKGSIAKKEQESKAEIKALEQTEQKLVLVKDRLSKIRTIESEDNAYREAELVNNVIDKLPDEIELQEVLIAKDKSSVTVSATSADMLTRFFESLATVSSEKMTLSTFKYEQSKGYEVEITFVPGIPSTGEVGADSGVL